MDELAVAAVIDAEERHHQERIRLRMLRDAANPFGMAVRKFKKLFRIPNDGAQHLCNALDHHMTVNGEGNIPKHLKILAALHFFTDGSYQAPVGVDSMLSMSQPSISRAIEETTNAIVDILTPRYINFPVTQQDKQQTMRMFQEAYNMPNTLGAVDGTHISIFKPPNNNLLAPGLLFYNRKGYYSINCQVVTNASGRIISINPNFPGSTHDTAVWQTSALAQHLEREFLQGEENQWLLGDKGYPLQPWLMTPVGEPATDAEQNYNEAHARARNVVEMTFGRLKNKLRCLHRHRTLHYSPEKSAKIIVACCTLHNMFWNVFVEDDDDDLDDAEDPEDDEPEHRPELDNAGAGYLAMAREKREALIQNFL